MLIETTDLNEQKIKTKQRIYQYLSLAEFRNRLSEILLDEPSFPKFEIDLDLLRREDPHLSEQCIENPLEMMRVFEEALGDLAKEHFVAQNADRRDHRIRVHFEGNLGRNTVTPRGLRSQLVNKLVKIHGIVISASKVRPRLLQSTHFCERNNSFLTYNYVDPMRLRMNDEDDPNAKEAVPLYDNEDNPIIMEYGLSVYKDVQILTMQEMPENVPTGLLSRSIEVILQEDLVDIAKPGDRVELTGILRPTISGQTISIGVFRTTIMGTSIKTLNSAGDVSITPQELKDIKAVSVRDDLLPTFCRSLAPAIAGHEDIKEALLLLLLGGSEKTLENGTRLRGDVNVLLVGDPSTGKSQFLRRVMGMANLSFSTTGRGSTGVGLTAAITFDKDTGEKQLEAGAMVLADRGVICVDEFDKMSVEDRVAMHEVMEQQTVTIAKAGIHVSLNARCSVLAAANPSYGEYIPSRSAAANIKLPDSLLSRFDLIFIVLDEKDPELDRMVAQRVTANHRYQGSSTMQMGFNDGSGVIEPAIVEDANHSTKVFEQFNHLLHENKRTQYFTLAFMKKYLAHAKKQNPHLSDSAKNYITQKWSEMRFTDHAEAMKHKNRILPVTIRSLESLIRLSTAYSKLRLASEVTILDCVHAFQIFMKAFYGGADKFDPTFFKDVERELGAASGSNKKAKKPRKAAKTKTDMEIESDEEESELVPKAEETSAVKRTRQSQNFSQGSNRKNDALDQLTKYLFQIMMNFKKNKKKSAIDIEQFWQHVNENYPDETFKTAKFEDRDEFNSMLKKLIDMSKILIDGGAIYVI